MKVEKLSSVRLKAEDSIDSTPSVLYRGFATILLLVFLPNVPDWLTAPTEHVKTLDMLRKPTGKIKQRSARHYAQSLSALRPA